MVCEVMEEPLAAPSVQETVAWVLPRVAVTLVGAVGRATAVRITGFDGVPDPKRLIAVTVIEYEVPPVNPVIVAPRWSAGTEMMIAGPVEVVAATEYETTFPLPALGFDHFTNAELAPADDETMFGARGKVEPSITDTESPNELTT